MHSFSASTLLILDFEAIGHSLEYVRGYAMELSPYYRIITVTPYPELFSDLVAENIYIRPAGDCDNLLDCLNELRSIIESRSLDYDWIMCPTFDAFFKLDNESLSLWSSLISGRPLVGVSYSLSHVRLGESSTQWVINRISKVAGWFNLLIITNDLYAQAALKAITGDSVQLVFVPDINFSASSSWGITRELNLFYDFVHTSDRPCCGVVGSIGKWKGYLDFLQGSSRHFNLVAAGALRKVTFSQQELRTIQTLHHTLKTSLLRIDRVLSGFEMHQLIEYLDVVYLNYAGPQPSGVWTKCLHQGSRYIHRGTHHIGDMTKILGLEGKLGYANENSLANQLRDGHSMNSQQSCLEILDIYLTITSQGSFSSWVAPFLQKKNIEHYSITSDVFIEAKTSFLAAAAQFYDLV